jgi:hypothetical protein
MSRSVYILLVFLLISLCSLSAVAQCDPNAGRVSLNLPASGSTITAPVEVIATGTASCAITSMQVYVDGILQWTQYGQPAMHLMVPAILGRHTLEVKGWTAKGKSFSASEVVYVSSLRPEVCKSSFDLDNYVWPCAPQSTSPIDSPVWISGIVRSDTSPLVETDITVNGKLTAQAFGATAYRPNAQFVFSPGMYSADISSSNLAGATMHNPAGFIVRSQVACQAPVISVMRPTPGDTSVQAQPVVFDAAADAGRQCKVTAMAVYEDGKLQYRAWNQSLMFGRLWLAPGTHRVTIQAWNNRGQVGKKTFTVTAEENLEGFCTPETTPGVMVCSNAPVGAGAIVGVGTPLDPPVPTTAARIYINGVKRADYYGDALLHSYMLVTVPPGTYKVTAVAWDASGAVSTDTQMYNVP